MLSVRNFPFFQNSPSAKSETSHGADNTNVGDQEVWRAFITGDEEAFIQLYNKYANVLYHYGCQFSPDQEMIKDCLQDFFVYLRKSRSGLKDTNFVKMYLLKAFRRRVLEYLKKHDKECRNNAAILYFQFPVELSSENIYINKQFEDEQIGRLNLALKALEEKEREAIYYFYYEGLGYEEIRQIFNFSKVSSARRLIYRGLDQLRKMILFYILPMAVIWSQLR